MGNWEANIRKVVPYVPGEQPKEQDIIKLNTNENPYPPAPEVLNKQVELENLRLYPDPAATKLVDAIAEYHGVDKNQVFVGVGSDDVLAMSFTGQLPSLRLPRCRCKRAQARLRPA